LQQAEEIEHALGRRRIRLCISGRNFTAQAGVRAFHLGAFKAAIATGRPVVPVALDGTRRVLRDGACCRACSYHSHDLSADPSESDAADWHEIVRVRDAAREIIARHAGEPLL